MTWLNLSSWFPCLFCGQERATHHRLCQFCWISLPWDRTLQSRQEVEFIASCHYDYPINRVIHQFKDQAQLQYLNLLTACLMQIPKPSKIHAIVPMPISTEKLIQRGFNQSYLLAHQLSKQWKIPLWQPIARHASDSQRGLDRHQRLHNLTEIFYPLSTEKNKYRTVLMVDDVITTGASLFALQQQLQLLGCSKIQAFCLCNAQG